MQAKTLQSLAASLAMLALATLFACCAVCSAGVGRTASESPASPHACCMGDKPLSDDSAPADSSDAPAKPAPCKVMAQGLKLGVTQNEITLQNGVGRLAVRHLPAPPAAWAAPALPPITLRPGDPAAFGTGAAPLRAPHATLRDLHTMLTI